ncbi:MAG: Co2+/Mg2+ efflux protein ApaG [Bryobacterales bacterium]|jgi:ApaG protein|nr:Co2+/Mg2+ efflux protein ApaG [Bryobacterales bacterium]
MPYTATTRQIRVTVEPIWLEEHSSLEENRFVWAYRVQIENLGGETVQLKTRHWIITDARGQVEHVRGPGVVGKQPRLAPGETFEYTSGCPLSTPSGFMGGTYRMVTADGETFDIDVPTFSLDSPHQRVVVN